MLTPANIHPHKMQKSFHQRLALVTGASSGIGREIARLLAAMGCHLILVARREQRLTELQSQLQEQFGVTVQIEVCDLANTSACEEFLARLQGKSIQILINNAGVGLKGDFAEQKWLEIHHQLSLNNTTLLRLTHWFIQQLQAEQAGWIMQVSSILGFLPCPNYAVYAATKSIVNQFSIALHYELKPRGILVSTLCPGPTLTEFKQKMSGKTNPIVDKLTMDACTVAQQGLQALAEGKPIFIAGKFNRLAIFVAHFIPKNWILRLVSWLSR